MKIFAPKCVAGVALYVTLDVDDKFTGVEADVDEFLDIFVRDATSPHSGVSVSCHGYVEEVEDDRDCGSRRNCRSVG
jgi:hypothetical protein